MCTSLSEHKCWDKQLTSVKYQPSQVQLTASVIQWVAETYWLVPLPVLQWRLIMVWIWMSMAYSRLHNSLVPYYSLQVHYWHSQLHSLNIQHSWWTRQIVHTPILHFQCCQLGIGQVSQNPTLTGKSYLIHPCLLLSWNISGASHKFSITCTCNKGLHFSWSPVSSRRQNLPQIICT